MVPALVAALGFLAKALLLAFFAARRWRPSVDRLAASVTPPVV
jgi:hypothetical protein